mgnify:CR=1 FL=1
MGLILYSLAPAIAVLPAAAATRTMRRSRFGYRFPLLVVVWSVAGLLMVMAGRFWIGAYFPYLIVPNNLLVLSMYAALLLVSVSVVTVVEGIETDLSVEQPQLSLRLSRAAGWLGVYGQLVGTVAFMLSPVNVYVRLIEGGVLVTFLSAFPRVSVALAEDATAGVIKRMMRSVQRTTVVFLAATLVLMWYRDLEIAPQWVDIALIYPAYAVAVSAPLLMGFSRIEVLASRAAEAGVHSAAPPSPRGEPASGDPPPAGARLDHPAGESFAASAGSQNPGPPEYRGPDQTEYPALASAEFFESVAAELGLTDREREVVRQLMVGASTVRIAESLGVSEKTVRNHISALYRKTETSNRVELVQVFEPAR